MSPKFNSDDNLPLKETLELYNTPIVIRSAFREYNKYYPQIFLTNVCINYKCYKINVSKGIDVNLIQDGSLRAAHRRQKGSPFLKSVTHILQ